MSTLVTAGNPILSAPTIKEIHVTTNSARPSRRIWRPLGVLAAVSVFSLTGCALPTGTSDGAGAGEGDDITIGLLAPLTGDSAADGLLMENGAKLAVDEINEAGGIDGHTVVLKTADVKGQSADAVSSAVSELTADSSVVAVFAGYASTTNFEIDLFAEADMPYIIGGNSDQTVAITEKDPSKYPTIWSLSPSYAGYTTDLPERLSSWNDDGTYPLRNKNAYIVSSDNPYSNGIASGLQENLAADGWTVTGPDTVPFGEVSDWTTQLAKIHDADPSINTDYLTANAAKFITQFSQNPTDSLVFSQYAPSVPEFLDLAGSAADGVLYNLPLAALPTTDAGKEVLDAYKTEYNSDPGLYGVLLHEQIGLWAEAAEDVGDPTDKAAVGAAIGKLDTTTAVGRVVFDQKTHLAMSGDDYQVQDGKRVTISPDAYAEGALTKPSWAK
jgi:branched-chain amino acid transport system substrate-binding protein